MTEQNRTDNRGISLSVVHFLMIMLAIIISLLLIYSTFQSSSVFSRLSAATSNYIVRQDAAHDLMQASDYLTEMAQRFALEGDTAYMDRYFEEAFVSQRREASIKAMADTDAEESLIAQLQEAMNESLSLMYQEYYSMRLVIEAKGIESYPEQLRATELKEEDALLSPDEKMDLAQTMVMGKEYWARKEIIRDRLQSSLNTMDKAMTSTRQETSAQLTRELSTVRWIIVILTVAILALIGLSIFLGTGAMLRAVKYARAGKPLPEKGAREYQILAKTYNEMHRKLDAAGEKEHPEDPSGES